MCTPVLTFPIAHPRKVETTMTAPASPVPTFVRELDPLKVQAFQEQLLAAQNPILGFAAGAVAAVVSATAWAVITYVANVQVGWMAIGVAFLVGSAIRQFGRGIGRIYSFVGAGLAFLAVVLGNLLIIAYAIAQSQSVSIPAVLVGMALHPLIDIDMLFRTAQPVDLLFYGFAIYYGYRYSIRRVTAAERAALYRERQVNP